MLNIENTENKTIDIMIITNSMLYQNKYDMGLLEQNLSHLDIKIILLTQKLDIPFILKYIIYNDDIIDESYVNIHFICDWQSHISIEELQNELDNY